MNESYFDKVIPRRNSHSYKWDSASDPEILPMWVADMDFRTAPPVIKALVKRAQHGIFGYTKVPPAYYDSVTRWFERRHGFLLNKKWLLFTTGVVPALSTIIMALANKGDKVIVQEPIYNCFFSSIKNNDCTIISNDLVYKNGTYSIDFNDLEQKAADPQTKLFLLCNPHNPVGRVWTKQELLRMGEICLRNNVFVVSDEIHCDLVYPGHHHIPFGSINSEFLNNSVTCTAPSKTFNIAGLQVANIIAANNDIRIKINKALNINEVCEINPFAIVALIAAYEDGEEWLDTLKSYLYKNYTILKKFLEQNHPYLNVLPLEATYLAWIDCQSLGISSSEIAQRLYEKEKLWINDGSLYGKKGTGFLRINLACPRQILIKGLEKINAALICQQSVQ